MVALRGLGVLTSVVVAVAIHGLFSRNQVIERSDGFVDPNRTYFFWTHRKTGTNLMQAICNLTALAVSGGSEECAWCLRALSVDGKGKYICSPDEHPEHGKLRATVGRFTLLSSIGPNELALIRRHTPNFRAIHMIREPVTMAISAYKYDKFVTTNAGSRWRWDVSAEEPAKQHASVGEELQVEANAILGQLTEMAMVHHLTSSDPRIMTSDLEAFEAGFDNVSTKLFTFLFDKIPTEALNALVQRAANYDTTRWSKTMLEGAATTAPSQRMNTTQIRMAWKALEDAGNEDVLKVVGFRETLGYAASPPEAKEAPAGA